MAKIGVAKIIINPDIGSLMSGFAPLRAYTEKHSDLYLRAVLIEDSQRTLFLGFDTIAIDAYLYREIVERVTNYNISEEHVIVSATHTHSGPVGLVNTKEGIFKGVTGLFGDYDSDFVQVMLAKVEEVLKEAINDLEEIASFKYGNTELAGIATERHDPQLPGDNRLVAWSYQTISGRNILFYNFACHPTVLNGSSPYLSSDFPGVVADELSAEYVVVNFINGSCGDISTRFTRKADPLVDVVNFGKKISQAVGALIAKAEPQAVDDIKVQQQTYYLKARQFESVEDAQATLEVANEKAKVAAKLPQGERRAIESFAEGARTNLAFAQNFKGIDEIAIPVTFLLINNQAFVSIPAELFSSLSNSLRADLGINILGYTNGYSLYIADENAYKAGYYEALSSIYQVGQGEVLLKEITKDVVVWLKEVRKEQNYEKTRSA